MAGVSLARTGRAAVSTAVAVAVFRKSRLNISSRRAELAEKKRQIVFEVIISSDAMQATLTAGPIVINT
jgi:hypothetical protein